VTQCLGFPVGGPPGRARLRLPSIVPRLLFICSRNRLRSPTAERVFATWPDVQTASAGVSPNADNPLDPELIAWAEIIFVMEPAHRRKLAAKFGKWLKNKRVICLDIPDDFDFMQPELIDLLTARVGRHINVDPEATH